METLRKHHISFGHAFRGLIWAIKTQPNFRIHFLLTFLAICIGFYVGLNPYEWVLIVFTIFWGLATELANTAFEAICDLITKEWRQEVRIAKDVAAAMMLTVAIGAVLVACLILLPKILVRI